MDAAYVVLVEEYQAVGSGRVPLVLAINSANELVGLPVDENIETINEEPAPPSNVPTAADNDRALAELQGMLRGIGG